VDVCVCVGERRGGETGPAPPHRAMRERRAQVSAMERDAAKHLTYGLVYGMGPAALASRLGGTSRAFAEELDASFKRSIPGAVAWAKQ
jgi:DNA polymerase I-like protein with 3'-5' exonuclease and polymerase domains